MKQSLESQHCGADGAGSWRLQIRGVSVGDWEGLKKKKLMMILTEDYVENSRVVLRVVF